MANQDLIRAARTTPPLTLSDSETAIDMARLRAYRLGRLRAEIIRRDYGACLFLDPINIRYATGHRNVAVFQTHLPASALFVPAEGPVVLYESPIVSPVAEGLETIDEIRPSYPLTFFSGGERLGDWMARWVLEITDLARTHGGGNQRLGIGRCDPRLSAGLAAQGFEVVDALAVAETARTIKSPDEILCMNAAITAGETGMARMREALKPGITEIELWSLLHQANIAMGGEWVECRLLSSGERANPWQREASSRVIRAGELVAFDTDMIGPFGYIADVSRTYHCGPGRPTPAQRDLYKLAYEEVHHNLALIRAGLDFHEFSDKAYRPPAEYIANRYDLLAHGVGMCDEYPTIYYPIDRGELSMAGVLEEGMTLSVESFMGAEGGGEGVKLEQQIVVTEDGYELLSRFPFEDELLA